MVGVAPRPPPGPGSPSPAACPGRWRRCRQRSVIITLVLVRRHFEFCQFRGDTILNLRETPFEFAQFR